MEKANLFRESGLYKSKRMVVMSCPRTSLLGNRDRLCRRARPEPSRPRQVKAAGTYYLTANHTTWHPNQEISLSTNGAPKVTGTPYYNSREFLSAAPQHP